MTRGSSSIAGVPPNTFNNLTAAAQFRNRGRGRGQGVPQRFLSFQTKRNRFERFEQAQRSVRLVIQEKLETHGSLAEPAGGLPRCALTDIEPIE